MSKPTILVVDDDALIRDTVKSNLERDGYAVVTAASAGELDETLEKGTQPDTILLDLVLPDGDGLGLIAKIRSYTEAPVIIVSSKGESVDTIVGLEMGADDYISKPFQARELSARVKANLRRYQAYCEMKSKIRDAAPEKSPRNAKKLRFCDFTLDRDQMQVFDDTGADRGLTTQEFRLMESFALAPHRVLSREQLLELSRGDNVHVYDRAVDIQIARIRKKIDDESGEIIKTVRGAGYMLAVDVEPLAD